eukprot:TRINITY_DN67571_c10_g1_i1.p1 TRINITY_DN67571_c10_g1~~TRINITY_DN67571_c10_g1_i1.p1  ORF type:complete len:998 (+),score=140.38 TRINITY_DN67571_c10_g1_i1:28-3021(+)
MFRFFSLWLILIPVNGFIVHVRYGDVDGIDFDAPGTFNVKQIGCYGCPNSAPRPPAAFHTKLDQHDMDLNRILMCTTAYGGEDCSIPDELPELEVNVIEGDYDDVVESCAWDLDECENEDDMEEEDYDINGITVNFFVKQLCEPTCFVEKPLMVANPDPAPLGEFAHVFSPFQEVELTLSLVHGATCGTLQWTDMDGQVHTSESVTWEGSVYGANRWLRSVRFAATGCSSASVQSLRLEARTPDREAIGCNKLAHFDFSGFVGDSTLTILAGTTYTVSGNEVYETVTCQSGTTLEIPTGATLTATTATVGCTVTGGGVFRVPSLVCNNSGALNTVTIEGDITAEGTCTLAGITTNGTISAPSSGTLTLTGLTGGRIIGTGIVLIRGTVRDATFDSGTYRVVDISTLLNVAVCNDVEVSTRLTLSGTMTSLPGCSPTLNVVSGGFLLMDATLTGVSIILSGGSTMDILRSTSMSGGAFTCLDATINTRAGSFGFSSGPLVFGDLGSSEPLICIITGQTLQIPPTTTPTLINAILVENIQFNSGSSVTIALLALRSNGRVINMGTAQLRRRGIFRRVTDSRAPNANPSVEVIGTFEVAPSIPPAPTVAPSWPGSTAVLRTKASIQQDANGFAIEQGIHYILSQGGSQIINQGMVLLVQGTCSIAGDSTQLAGSSFIIESQGTSTTPGCQILSTATGGDAGGETGTTIVRNGGSLEVVGPVAYAYSINADPGTITKLARGGQVTLTRPPEFLGAVYIGPANVVTDQQVTLGSDPVTFIFGTNANGGLSTTGRLVTPASGTPTNFDGQSNFSGQQGTTLEFYSYNQIQGQLLAATLSGINGVQPVTVEFAGDGTGDVTLQASGSTTGIASTGSATGSTGSSTGSNTPTTPTPPATPSSRSATPATPSDSDDDGSSAAAIAIPTGIGGLLLIIIIVAVVVFIIIKSRSGGKQQYAQPGEYAYPQQPGAPGPMVGQPAYVASTGWSAPATTPVDGIPGSRIYM